MMAMISVVHYQHKSITLSEMEDEANLTALRNINNNSYIQIEHEAEQHPPAASPPPQQPDQSGHVHSEACSHGHGEKGGHQHGEHGHHHGKPGQKNYGIIVYTIFTCLSCLYLETQHLNPLLDDQKGRLMTCLVYFDVFMCLWSYFQTMRISNNVEKLQEKEPRPYRLDYKKRCEKCDYWKGPRYSHCSSCGKCIYKLDHHCMWTQTCIGHCNQRPFYLFCFYMTIGVFQFWYSSIRVASRLIGNCMFFSAFEPGIYILWAVTCLSAGLVGLMIVALFIGHTCFVTTNSTTLEGMKAKRNCNMPFLECRAQYLDKEAINLWDRGEIQNIKSIFGNNILTFWMPFGRKIQNQHVFEPMNPQVEPIPIEAITPPLTKAEAEGKMKGKLVKVDDRIVQL